VAAIVETADGRRFFVKAAAPELNPDTPHFHRREAVIAGALPEDAPAPRLLWTYDEGEDGWIVLVYEALSGRNPHTPWQADELDRVVAALIALSDALTPSPVPEAIAGRARDVSLFARPKWWLMREYPPEGIDGWSVRNFDRLVELEARARTAIDGDTLIHLDLRADNTLVTDRGVMIVDWPHARVGAPWVDLLGMAPSVALQGGPPPDELLLRHPAARAADPDDINAGVAALAAYFTYQSFQPPPPGLPTVRAFQRAQGEITRAWLAKRTGWT
jgi:aminoglycoside phosphotransferase (APT) family kinase protein